MSKSTAAPLCGIVNVHKPSGLTSRDVVDVVKRLVYPARTGHAGTLDPLASGVLVVGVGPATRLIDYVQRSAKRYRGTFLLGRSSPTEDIEGPLVVLDDPTRPTRDEIQAAARAFVGVIEQMPPIYSAKKVNGRRAYDLARAGKEVVLAPHTVRVDEITICAYDYPELVLDIVCGAGTYIRSLGRDLAAALGTAAVMSALVRKAVGNFSIELAWTPERLRAEPCDQWLQPALTAVADLPRVVLSAGQMDDIRCGRFVRAAECDIAAVAAETPEIAAVDPVGNLAAILFHRGLGSYGPRINLAAAARAPDQFASD